MKKRNKLFLLLLTTLYLISYPSIFAKEKTDQNNTTFSIDLYVDKLGVEISPTLNGIFYEDINQANDGGISAQLIQNNSFQMYNHPVNVDIGPPDKRSSEFSKSPTDIYSWTIVKKGDAKGAVTTINYKPLTVFPEYYNFDPDDEYDDALKYEQYCVRVDIEQAGIEFGLAANGFGIAPHGSEREGFYYSNNTQIPSIPINAGIKYELGLYLQGVDYKGNIKVYLENAEGKLNSNVLTFKDLKGNWSKFTGELTALRNEDNRMAIVGDAAGTFYLDFVTLVPEKSLLWKNGKYGHFRKDLLEALEGLNPAFMRFPGGCVAEGPNYWGQYFWKTTIGPIEERIGIRNHWGTWTSQHIGYYEYLCMAEGLGATPIPVVGVGVNHGGRGRYSYLAPLETEKQRKRFYDIYVQDALDLIEFCNGDISTKWGAKRAKFGHPEPFNLQYLAIGNENRGNEFWERFGIVHDAVVAKYPDIKIISTSGMFASGADFDLNYKYIDEEFPNTIVDEHYYMNANWFYSNLDRYAPNSVRGGQGNSYDRSKPTRVFIGEFADNQQNNAYVSTLAEAAYYTGIEQNSDMVVMAAYAPLLCKKGFSKWHANLIYFDNRGLWRTSNYYYMSLFSNNIGNKTFETSQVKKSDNTIDKNIYTSATIDSHSGEIFLKAVNPEKINKEMTVNIQGDGNKRYQAMLIYMSSEDLTIKNQNEQNYYHGAPDIDTVCYDEAITPDKKDLGIVKGSFKVTIPLHSVNVIKLIPMK